VIIHPTGVVHGKRPKTSRKVVRPVDERMTHQSTGLPDDGLNGPLGDPILMMGADAGQAVFLAEFPKMRSKLRRGEGTIIEMIMRHRNTVVAKTGLEKRLGPEGVRSRQGDLMEDPDKARGMVHEDGTAMKTGRGTVSAIEKRRRPETEDS
jgi:hypothetical protein